MSNYLIPSEAWKLIPRFDGEDPNNASDIINACMYVASRVDPARKADLLESILNTKIQGSTAIILKLNGITTFEELKTQLRLLYPAKRPIVVVRSEFKSCHQRSNETLCSYIVRLKRLMNELSKAWSESVESPREKWTIRKLVRHMALDVFVKGLKPNFEKTKRRGFLELSSAMLGALEEEKLQKFPHLSRITCNWCTSKGHIEEHCFLRIWFYRNRRRMQPKRF